MFPVQKWGFLPDLQDFRPDFNPSVLPFSEKGNNRKRTTL
jgi:hypothetical protein